MEHYLDMTHLALNLCHYVNGVARKHAEVLRQMFAQYRIDAITNGVHATTWTSQPFQALFDQHMPGWREENFTLLYALSIPLKDVWEAHDKAKPFRYGLLANRVIGSDFPVSGCPYQPESLEWRDRAPRRFRSAHLVADRA